MSLKKVYYDVFAEGNILTLLIEIACREKMRRRLYSNHVTHFIVRVIRINFNLTGKKIKQLSSLETLIARFRAFLYSDSLFQADPSSGNKSPASAFIISRVLPEWC